MQLPIKLLFLLSIEVLSSLGIKCGLQFRATSSHGEDGIFFGRHSGGRIIRGEKAETDEFPFIVSIQLLSRNTWHVHCGGSILDENTILTAGHCKYPYGIKNPKYRIVAGCRKVFGDEVKPPRCQIRYITAADFTRHHLYEDNMPNDVAIIRFPSPFIFTNETGASVGPICLISRNEPSQGLAAVAGWGRIYETKHIASKWLKVTDVNILPEKWCKVSRENTTFQGYSRFNSRLEICAGYFTGSKDSCSGDSGGPLMITKKHQVTQIGIVSYGPEHCASERQPGVYVKVNKFIPWIKKLMKNKELIAQIKG